MQGLPRIQNLFLLITIVIGGLVMPGLHRLQHARTDAALRAAHAGQVDHVHRSFAAFSAALETLHHAELLCVVCSTPSCWTLLRSVADAPNDPFVAAPREAAQILSSSLPLICYSRGPPAA